MKPTITFTLDNDRARGWTNELVHIREAERLIHAKGLGMFAGAVLEFLHGAAVTAAQRGNREVAAALQDMRDSLESAANALGVFNLVRAEAESVAVILREAEGDKIAGPNVLEDDHRFTPEQRALFAAWETAIAGDGGWDEIEPTPLPGAVERLLTVVGPDTEGGDQ